MNKFGIMGEKLDIVEANLKEKIVKLNKCSKVVKGGRRFGFSVLMVVGDKAGHVGMGFGKANEVSDAIRKGIQKAKKNMIRIILDRSKRTIPHELIGSFNRGQVWLKPAAPGTGLIAGGAVRIVLELCGIVDILSKIRGSRNQINVVKAVFEGLKSLKDVEVEARKRGKMVKDLYN